MLIRLINVCCGNCGKFFSRSLRNTNARRKINPETKFYCSKPCYTCGHLTNNVDRLAKVVETKNIKADNTFWAKVDKSPGLGPNGDCWEWTRYKDKRSGYGWLSYRGYPNPAHRIAYCLIFGHMPLLDLLHSCDNPPCVNPEHLREGTQLDNIQDMVNKRRHAHGAKNGHAKLEASEVLEIRAAKLNGIKSKDLAEKYNITPGHVNSIWIGTTWKNLISPEL